MKLIKILAFLSLCSYQTIGLAGTDIPYVVLNKLFRVKTGSDYFTTSNLVERNMYTSDGIMYYIPYTAIPQTMPLYRLYKSPDHMDSRVSGELGYLTEGILGWAYTSPTIQTGLVQINRGSNGVDHALMRPGETLVGYNAVEKLPAYGYQRFGNDAEGLNYIQGGGVTVYSNSVAGGSIWRLKWNGIEFVNTEDYGREIQSALFYIDSYGLTHNPTEAGDRFTGSAFGQQDKNGSPLRNNHNSGNLHVTRSVPLEWDPVQFGGSPEHPIIYPDLVIGKDLEMNYANLGSASGSVIRYASHLESKYRIDETLFEMPTAYLNGEFDTYYIYDAAKNSFKNIVAPKCLEGNKGFHLDESTPDFNFSGYGGVIASRRDGSAAMAIYGSTLKVGGKVKYFDLWDVTCHRTNKLSAVYYGPMNAGDNVFNTYLSIGTFSTVVQNMRTLYLRGIQ